VTTDKLKQLLGSVAEKMLADFKGSSAAEHRGSKGTVREAILLENYLKKYLPRTVVAEHSGEVITVAGDERESRNRISITRSAFGDWSAGSGSPPG